MTLVALLESAGAIAAMAALLLLGRRTKLGGPASEVYPVLITLLVLSALTHACDGLEAIGIAWADRMGDTLGVLRPVLWSFLLFALGRALLAEQLRFQEQQLRFFFAETPAAVAVLDKNERLLASSRRFRDDFVGDRSEGQEPLTLSDCRAGLADLLRAPFQSSISTAEPDAGVEPQPWNTGTELRWLIWSLRPWFQQGHVGGVVLLVQDVTPEVRAEEQFRVQEMNLQRASLEDAVALVAGGVAHDVRNFLLTISAHTDFIADSLPKRSDVGESVESIHEAVVASNELLTTLTSFGQRAARSDTSLELCGFLERSRKLLSRFLPRSIALEVRLDTERDVLVRIHGARLQQVLLNLAVNARDAMPHGGTLSVVLELRGTAAAEEAVIAVNDTGTGIPLAIQTRLFEPRFTTKPASGGSGLGLAIVAEIMKAAGGTVSVSSRLGEGATFELRFPCESRPRSASARPHTTSSSLRA